MINRSVIDYVQQIRNSFQSPASDALSKSRSAIKNSYQKESLFKDIQLIDHHNKESEERLLKSLQNLANQTESYERKLQQYRFQLQQKQILNEKMYKEKIMEMIREYDIMKDKVNQIKCQQLIKLRKLRRLIRAFMALLIYKNHQKLNEVRIKMLKKQQLRNLFQRIDQGLTVAEKMSKLPLSQFYFKKKQNQITDNVLKKNRFNSLMKQMEDQLNKYKIIAHTKKPKSLGFNLVFSYSLDPDASQADSEQSLGDALDGHTSMNFSRATQIILQQLQQRQPLYIKIPSTIQKGNNILGSLNQPTKRPTTQSNQLQHIHLNIDLQEVHQHGHHKKKCQAKTCKVHSPVKSPPTGKYDSKFRYNSPGTKISEEDRVRQQPQQGQYTRKRQQVQPSQK